MLSSSLAYNQVDGGGEPVPVRGFLIQLGAAGGGERVELCLASGFAFRPLCLDPALLFEAVEGGIERTLLDLEHFAGKLLNPLGDSPSVHGVGQEGFQDQKIEGALDEITWF